MPIQQQSGLVVIDARGCDARQLFERYEAFGLLCARGQVRRALLKLGDDDADAHYTLRDILATLVGIAGVRLAFSLALVATADSTARVCHAMQAQLGALGCEARVFRIEGEAQGWLRAGRPQTRRAPEAPAAGSLSLRGEKAHRVGVTADLRVRDLA